MKFLSGLVFSFSIFSLFIFFMSNDTPVQILARILAALCCIIMAFLGAWMLSSVSFKGEL